MLIEMVLLIFVGVEVGRRTIEILIHQKIITSRYGSGFQVAHCLLLGFGKWIFSGNEIFFWSWILFLFGTPIFFAKLVERVRIQRFNLEFRVVLDEISSELRMGKSVRAAMEGLRSSKQFGFYTTEALACAVHKREDDNSLFSSAPLRSRLDTLKNVAEPGVRVFERLQFFRRSYHLTERFRRKSRAATAQARAQAIVVVLLYLSLLAFQMSMGRLRWSSLWALLSFGLMVAGLTLFYFIGRSFRWKV